MLDSLGPILLILIFYALLGAAVWVILHWTELPRPNLQLPEVRLADDPFSRRTQIYALWTGGGGLLLLLLQGPLVLGFAGVQLLAIALLLLLYDRLERFRRREDRRRDVIAALGSLNRERVGEALKQAAAEGWLTDGSLCGQSLCAANWHAAALPYAKLDRVDFSRADLEAVTAPRAAFHGAVFDGANLDAAVLDGCGLTAASLVGTRARAASLRAADLTQADLRGARLQNADLTGAILRSARFAGTNLKGAVLVGADLHGATYDAETKWPKHFRPEAAGAHNLGEPTAPKDEEQSHGDLR